MLHTFSPRSLRPYGSCGWEQKRLKHFSTRRLRRCLRALHCQAASHTSEETQAGQKSRQKGNDSQKDQKDTEKDAEKKLEKKRISAERKRAREKNFNPEGFHLPTAIALGCCSFEAYNAPYCSFGVKEVSPCTSQTIFTDHDFLAKRIQGVLEVHLKRGIGLVFPPEKDSADKKKGPKALDTRCRVCVHPSAGFSETYQRSSDPVWRRTFFLYVQDCESQTLDVLVEAVTDEKEEENLEIGSACIDNLNKLCDGEIHDLVLPLKRNDKDCGEVHLSVRFQCQDEQRDLLRSIKGQAVGQMINDDWCFGASNDWEHGEEDSDWRYTGMPQGSDFAVLNDKEPIDIEGGELAEGQPLSRQPWKDWTKLRELVVEEHNFPSLNPVAFVMNKESDTELWVYANWEERKIAISFRGTSSPKDMLTDMSLDLAAFNPEGDDESKQPEDVAQEISEEEWENGPFGGLYKALKTVEKLPITHAINKLLIKTAKGKKRASVTKGLSGWAKAQMMMLYALEHDHKWCHNGFLQAYTSVSQAVLRLVDDIMGMGDDKGGRWQILLTGHSMGGALSCCCAYELAKRDYSGEQNPKITVYSFGQPRVGNKPFASAFDEAVPDTWRIKNADDIVTTVPGLLGYTHVGNEVKLTSDGEVTVSCISTDNIREGEFIADLIPRLKDGMTGEDKELQEELKQLMMGEVKMMKAIIKGDGVSQHMEDIYHNYLKSCSRKGKDFAAPVREAVQSAKERVQ